MFRQDRAGYRYCKQEKFRKSSKDAVMLVQRLQGELFLFLDMCSGLL